MRRRTRKSIAQLLAFGLLLGIILVANNHPQSSTKTYAWNEIRYQSSTPSIDLPQPHGICPSLAQNSKPALVVSRVEADGDPQWLDKLSSLYHLCVYKVDAPLNSNSQYLQVPTNRGHEAMAYLTFLVDNYERLPSAVVFVHGSRWAWHNDWHTPEYDNAALLAALNIPAALAPWGYHNLRCDWSLSTCPFSASPQGSLETSFQAMTSPWDTRAVSDAALPKALADIFGRDVHDSADMHVRLDRSDIIRSQCCAQFVVSRSNILKHSRAEYAALRQWLLDGSRTDVRNAAPLDDRTAGRILSYVWHILFMKATSPRNDLATSTDTDIDLENLNTAACPSASECYCRLYGRCNLKGCTSGSCLGQYNLPAGLKVPDELIKEQL